MQNMLRSLHLAAAAGLAALVCGPAVAQGAAVPFGANPIPIEDFAREPAISSVSMSLEGDRLVALVHSPGSNGEWRGLASWDLNNLSAGPVITPGNDRMRFFGIQATKRGKVFARGRSEFVGAGAGTCGLEGGGSGATRTFVDALYATDVTLRDIDLAFQGRRSLTAEGAFCAQFQSSGAVVSAQGFDPDNILVERVNAQRTDTILVQQNLRTGATRNIGSAEGGLLDAKGMRYLTRVDLDTRGGENWVYYEIFNTRTNRWEKHPELEYKIRERVALDIAGWDEATGNFYVVTDKFSDLAQLWIYNPFEKKFEDGPAFAHPRFSVAGVRQGSRASDWNQLLGVTYAGDVFRTFWVDPDLDAIQKGLEQRHPGMIVTLLNWTDSRNRVLFSTESAASPPTYYILDDKSRELRIGSERPWIKSETLADTELVYYPARDGLEIPAFLTLPGGWKKGDARLPVIVLPHGGPWARDFGGWDSSGWVPFLTSRGYAVLQPQYRGTEGFGQRLWKAGDQEWGQKMQDDKDDGARWLVSEGIADANRMAIFGYSYGGFAAYAATVRENGPFRCAIAGAGVASLELFRTRVSQGRINRQVQGWTITGMDPMDNVAKANIPLLSFHGDGDVRVPIGQAENFHRALVAAGKKSEFVTIPGMWHSLPWWPQQQRLSLSAIEEFLANDCQMGGAMTGLAS
jgi:acetyl esterase/lipase